MGVHENRVRLIEYKLGRKLTYYEKYHLYGDEDEEMKTKRTFGIIETIQKERLAPKLREDDSQETHGE